jgi:hypothetical protein
MNQAASSAVVVADDFRPREVIRLGDYDRSKYNVLIPGAFTSQMTPFLVPVAREYTLDPDPEHGEVYVQEWKKQGDQFLPKAMGINALGLANLANVAGILEIPQASGRVDDGRDPGVCTYRSTMFMRLPDGQPVIRTRELTLDLAQLYEEIETRITKKGAENKWNGRPEPWPAKRVRDEIRKEQQLARKFFHRKCETGAKARTHRVMLGIRSKYKPDEIARPFVLAAVVPDVNQPEMRERMLDQATSSIGMIFGGQAGSGDVARPARQLGAGSAPAPTSDGIEAAVDEGNAAGAKPTAEELAELAGGAVGPGDGADDAGDDGDDQAAAAYQAAAAKPVPPWAQPAEAEAAVRAKPTASTRDQLIQALQSSSAGAGMTGAMTTAQQKRLQKITAGLDWDKDTVPLLVDTWGPEAVESLSPQQAQALINAADSLGGDEALQAVVRGGVS